MTGSDTINLLPKAPEMTSMKSKIDQRDVGREEKKRSERNGGLTFNVFAGRPG
jgi:hypothetical protein